MHGVGNKMNDIGEWVYRLLVLNMLWVIFAGLGLGVLGVFPATHALFSVLRKSMMNKRKVHLAKDFVQYYRKDFWKINLLGYLLVVTAGILWIDFQYLMAFTSSEMFMLFGIILGLLALSVCVLFPIYTHYELSLIQYVKHVLLYPITHMGSMFLLVLSYFLYYLIAQQLPGMIIFLGISLPCFLTAKIIFPTFKQKGQNTKGWFRRQKDQSIYY